VSSLVLVFALGTVLALVGLALNSASVSNHRVQLQAACEAAALAGAAELMDPGHLYVNTESNGSISGDPASDLPSIDRCVDRARQRAIRFAAQNGVAGKPLLLAANGTNDPHGDLVVGWVEDPTSLDSEFMPWTGTGPVNSLRVQAARSHLRGNPLARWFGRILGASDTDVVASARATVDQRVYGFRPVGHVRAPLVPIMLSFVEASVRTPHGSTSTVPGSADRYTVDPLSGDVRPGPDGIAEIALRIGLVEESSAGSAADLAADPTANPAVQAGNAFLLSLDGRGPDYALLQEQIVQGLTAEHLEALGGELALDRDGRLRLFGIDLWNAAQLNKVGQMLLDVRGQKRIWPTGTRSADRSDNSGCEIEGFMAGSVVDGYLETDTCLTIVVQPCLLQTCTALVGTGKDRNPWIGKLVLDR